MDTRKLAVKKPKVQLFSEYNQLRYIVLTALCFWRQTFGTKTLDTEKRNQQNIDKKL